MAKATTRKGIGLQMIAGMILASIGVLLLIGLAANNFSFKGLYCSTASRAMVVLPHTGPEPPAPKGCRTQDTEFETTQLEISDTNEVVLRLSGAIVDCWDKYKGYGDVKKQCQAFVLENLQGTVYEYNINAALQKQKLCPQQIENNQIEAGGGSTCGEHNQIKFTASDLTAGEHVLITYENGAIHVR